MQLIKFVFLLRIIGFFTIIESRKLPVIAILSNSQPDDTDNASESRVNAMYVHWLEQSLADVVVINPWYDEKTIDEILSKVNGVLLLGGDRNLRLDGQFESVSRMILNKIMKKYDEGISIPLWGTCQGFELLHVLFANSLKVLTNFEANAITTPVTINKHEILTSKMFSDFTQQDLLDLQTKNTTAEFHHLGVAEYQYETFPKLREIFKITSYGKDIYGKEYIASVEGKKYPIFGIQFHPEMVPYTKIQKDGVPKIMEAVKISQLLSNFFIKQASMNNNSMSIEDMNKFDYLNSFIKLPTVDINKEGFYYYYFAKKTEQTKRLRHS